MTLLCLCGAAFEPADALDESCKPCKRLEAARAYARRKSAERYEATKADPQAWARLQEYNRRAYLRRVWRGEAV